MLRQLWDLWRDQRLGPQQVLRETKIWMEQHSVDADDFAFSLACSLRDWIEPSLQKAVDGWKR
jgi:hypothetical protein